MKGEDSADLASELGLSVQKLESWKSEFLAAGESALTGATPAPEDAAPASDADAPAGDFSETSWFMAAVDLEQSDDIPENVDVE